MLAMTLSSCGLSQRERAIADTNAQIVMVDQTSEALARSIYDLPEVPNTADHFEAVTAAYQAYRQEVDREVESALRRCESAVTVFVQPDADEEGYREALTSLCLCVERYAAAVTAVSREYARLAG